jgi:hypothetical protein
LGDLFVNGGVILGWNLKKFYMEASLRRCSLNYPACNHCNIVICSLSGSVISSDIIS